jgi:hypothetical protein
VADAVWDEAQSGHTTAGTFGKYVDAQISAVSAPTAAAVADAVWDEALAGHLATGSTGAALNTASGSPQVEVSLVSPVTASQDIELRLGDDYYTADGRSIQITDATPATWPSLSGATVKFICGALSGASAVTATVTNPTGPATITVELSSTNVASIGAGIEGYEIDATLASGHKVTLVTGVVTVLTGA